jgi:predicted CoA-binding protein
MSTPSVREEIEAFWAQSRLAVVGVARDPQEFGCRLFMDLQRWGYDAVPVNPNMTAIGDTRAYSRVQDITPGVGGALLLTSPVLNERIVHDCDEAGVRRVWFYGTGDRSHENAAAIAYCREKGIAVIPGYCPYMFQPKAPYFHKIHGLVARVIGQYPH